MIIKCHVFSGKKVTNTMQVDTIINNDCLSGLKQMDDECIDMCITSPPYWNLRDYNVDGQIGLEVTFDEYIQNLVDIFIEVKRVLKPKGTCFINLGDTFGTVSGTMGNDKYVEPKWEQAHDAKNIKQPNINMHKCLLMIPERFAISMINAGWILRNQIIWHKPNAMPTSASDRFTVDFEKIFFFVKNKQYYFNQQFDAYTEPLNRWGGNKTLKQNGSDEYSMSQRERSYRPNDNGKNKRTVWSINTSSYSGAHFACYPQKLIETPILAGCPEGGVVLDPFMGSGTTAIVARKLNRHYIGIELNQNYIQIANNRIYEELGMFK